MPYFQTEPLVNSYHSRVISCNPKMLRSKPWAWELQLSHMHETWWGLELLAYLEILISQQLGHFIFILLVNWRWWRTWWNIDVTVCLKRHRSWIAYCIWEFHLEGKELKSEPDTSTLQNLLNAQPCRSTIQSLTILAIQMKSQRLSECETHPTS